MSLQDAVIRWCELNNVQLKPRLKKGYALPNGKCTNSRAYATEQWELYELSRNVVRNNNSRKLQYCLRRG